MASIVSSHVVHAGEHEQVLIGREDEAGTSGRHVSFYVRASSDVRQARDAYYREYLRTEPIEIDEVIEVLNDLSHHVRMAIVTTAKRADFDLIHQHRQITSYMDFVLVREDYTLAKPDPEPYLTGMKRFGASKAETLVVEDSARGLRSAVAAGIDCAVVHNEFTKSQDFSTARYRVGSLAELADIVLDHT